MIINIFLIRKEKENHYQRSSELLSAYCMQAVLFNPQQQHQVVTVIPILKKRKLRHGNLSKVLQIVNNLIPELDSSSRFC